jgi:hypothetical protein
VLDALADNQPVSQLTLNDFVASIKTFSQMRVSDIIPGVTGREVVSLPLILKTH